MMSRTSKPLCFSILLFFKKGTDLDILSKIKYSFAAELRDTGDNGFILPPDQIRPSGEEIWAGVKYLLANIQ